MAGTNARGDKGKHAGSHDALHTGRGSTETSIKCMAFSAPIRYSGKGQVRVGCPTQRRISACTATLRRLANDVPRAIQPRLRSSGRTARGDKTFLNGMFMGMAQRPLGEGTFGLRAMLAPDPFMGANGYPLIFATGETADGRTHLIDRQHPHDLFMELATTYSYAFNKNSSVYVYAGLPGEPALGPSAFMHRTSGMDIPEAPITHHWLDSTHITFGVLTAGVVLDTWKLEASAFKGREPDQYRYDIEAPKLDSYSARISWNPIRELSLQVSWGHLKSPEGSILTRMRTGSPCPRSTRNRSATTTSGARRSHGDGR